MIEELTLTNETLGESIFMDMLTSPYILYEVDLGSIPATLTTSKFVNQIGEFLTNSSMGMRQISITGYIVGDTFNDIVKRKQKLASIVNPLQDTSLLIGEYVLDFVATNTIRYSSSYEDNNEVLCKFLISGKAVDPLFKQQQEIESVVANTIGKFHFPLIIPKDYGIIMGERQKSLIAKLYNDGQVTVGMKIVIFAKTTVINPKIIDINTQQFIKIDKTLEPGERVVINTDYGNESVRGQKESDLQDDNYFRYWNLDSSWIKLPIGETLIRYDAEQNTIDGMEVYIHYSKKYLEVQ